MTTFTWTAIAATALFALASGTSSTPRDDLVATSGATAGGMPDSLFVHPTAAQVRWKGTNFAGIGEHEGTVALSSGLMVIRHGKLTASNFTIDMRRLQVTDVPVIEPVSRRTLRTRLMGAGLLDVERFPTATFVATDAKRIGDARWQVSGDLTMRGVTRPITFATDIAWPEVGHMIATSSFSIDRRQWGLAFTGSRLPNALADDDVQLSIRLDARRRGAQVAAR
jgi:polyisoprenoid-binding protein YceI